MGVAVVELQVVDRMLRPCVKNELFACEVILLHFVVGNVCEVFRLFRRSREERHLCVFAALFYGFPSYLDGQQHDSRHLCGITRGGQDLLASHDILHSNLGRHRSHGRFHEQIDPVGRSHVKWLVQTVLVVGVGELHAVLRELSPLKSFGCLVSSECLRQSGHWELFPAG